MNVWFLLSLCCIIFCKVIYNERIWDRLEHHLWGYIWTFFKCEFNILWSVTFWYITYKYLGLHTCLGPVKNWCTHIKKCCRLHLMYQKMYQGGHQSCNRNMSWHEAASLHWIESIILLLISHESHWRNSSWKKKWHSFSYLSCPQ